MWPFKKHIDSLADSGMFNGFTDWHSHILPGVDDGIKNMEDSLAVLKRYEELGVKTVWLTPHIMEDCPNTTQELRDRFVELQKAYDGPIELHLAAENMIDNLFEERLENNDVLTIGEDGRHLLVETSYFTPPMDFDGVIDKILRAGYFPLLAHPERYRYMEEKDYEKLRDRNVRFQINFNSLVGGYGETARAKAEWMLKNGIVEVCGSDLHRLNSFNELVKKSPKKSIHLEKLMDVAGHPVLP